MPQTIGGMIEVDPVANTVKFLGPTIRSVTNGITASTSQSQGNGALTASINIISTVPNPNDVVTLLPAVAGLGQEVINEGANDLQIFPASGDNLGAGLNLSTSIEAGNSIIFIGIDATNWSFASISQISHGEMQDTANTDAFVINAQTDAHVYHSNGMAAGDLSSGWTFDAGGAGTPHAIASIADGAAAGVDIEVTTSDNHLLAAGAIVSQTNLTSAVYTGVFVVKAIISDTQYEVAAVFTATDTGTMDEAATLTASALAAGTYLINYSYSTTTVGNNETLDFDIFLNTTSQGGGLAIREKFGTGADFSSGTGTGLIDIVSGDKLSLCVINTSSAGNITVRNFGMVPIKL